MKILVQFSGGKDSLAALIWARENISKNITAVFCDTGWEAPETYTYIKEITQKLEVELITIRSKKYVDFLDMARKKKRFPSTKARFCTTELKVRPMIDFILDEVKGHFLAVQGIRKDESLSRSKMDESCTYFKYYKVPYGYDKNGKPKYHTYRKKEVFQFIKTFANDILRPVFYWSAEETVNYILEHDLKLNPLYLQGNKRVGCWPCIMCIQPEIKALIKHDNKRIELIANFEKETGSSFFPPDKIPKWACANKKYPTIQDVVKYINAKNATLDMFDTGNNSCASYYNICE